MARKSVVGLVVVPLSGGGRPEPPGELDTLEQSIWKAVVDASPAHAIDPAAQLILRRLVARAAIAEPTQGTAAQDRYWGEDADVLAAAHGAAAKLVTFLLSSLRCTPRSRVRIPPNIRH